MIIKNQQETLTLRSPHMVPSFVKKRDQLIEHFLHLGELCFSSDDDEDERAVG